MNFENAVRLRKAAQKREKAQQLRRIKPHADRVEKAVAEALASGARSCVTDLDWELSSADMDLLQDMVAAALEKAGLSGEVDLIHPYTSPNMRLLVRFE